MQVKVFARFQSYYGNLESGSKCNDICSPIRSQFLNIAKSMLNLNDTQSYEGINDDISQ